MALEVILRLDVAQELRPLSVEERDIRRRLKRKIVALAVMERARKRQNSRITSLKEGDANTRFFHLRVNHRRRKNFIHRLKHNNGWVVDHDHKKSVIQNLFAEVSKRGPPRHQDINWDNIPVPARDLQILGRPLRRRRLGRRFFTSPVTKRQGPMASLELSSKSVGRLSRMTL